MENKFNRLQIEFYVKSNNLEIEDLFIKDRDSDLLNIGIIDDFGLYLPANELEIYIKKIILFLKKEPLYIVADDNLEEYSIYIYEYFIYKDKSKK